VSRARPRTRRGLAVGARHRGDAGGAGAAIGRGLVALRRSGFPFAAPTWPTTVDRPAPERRVGIDYPTAWSRRYPARFVRALVVDNVTRPLAMLTASPEIRGEELLELVESPAIFVSNHASHVDTPLLLSMLPARFRHRTVVAAAADHFFDRTWKGHVWALTLAAIPIDRHRVNRRSADLAAELLEEGWNLIVFPEGGRSPDGWFQDFRGGAAYLAVRTGRPVVPIHLQGTWRVLPKDGSRPRRSPCRLTIGAPMTTRPDEDARRFGARIEQAVAVLADESTSDWWTARRRAASGTTPSARGPDAAAWRRSWALGPAPTARRDDDPGGWARRDPGRVS
jgi:1-acyl-sn-glycerol-3-phosphate acyltransferase